MPRSVDYRCDKSRSRHCSDNVAVIGKLQLLNIQTRDESGVGARVLHGNGSSPAVQIS